MVGREGGRGVFLHPLNFRSIVDGRCFVRGVLWHGWFGVLILCECIPNVSWHVRGDVSVDVVPGEFHTAEERSFPIHRHLVMFFQG